MLRGEPRSCLCRCPSAAARVADDGDTRQATTPSGIHRGRSGIQALPIARFIFLLRRLSLRVGVVDGRDDDAPDLAQATQGVHQLEVHDLLGRLVMASRSYSW